MYNESALDVQYSAPWVLISLALTVCVHFLLGYIILQNEIVLMLAQLGNLCVGLIVLPCVVFFFVSYYYYIARRNWIVVYGDKSDYYTKYPTQILALTEKLYAQQLGNVKVITIENNDAEYMALIRDETGIHILYSKYLRTYVIAERKDAVDSVSSPAKNSIGLAEAKKAVSLFCGYYSLTKRLNWVEDEKMVQKLQTYPELNQLFNEQRQHRMLTV